MPAFGLTYARCGWLRLRVTRSHAVQLTVVRLPDYRITHSSHHDLYTTDLLQFTAVHTHLRPDTDCHVDLPTALRFTDAHTFTGHRHATHTRRCTVHVTLRGWLDAVTRTPHIARLRLPDCAHTRCSWTVRAVCRVWCLRLRVVRAAVTRYRYTACAARDLLQLRARGIAVDCPVCCAVGTVLPRFDVILTFPAFVRLPLTDTHVGSPTVERWWITHTRFAFGLHGPALVGFPTPCCYACPVAGRRGSIGYLPHTRYCWILPLPQLIGYAHGLVNSFTTPRTLPQFPTTCGLRWIRGWCRTRYWRVTPHTLLRLFKTLLPHHFIHTRRARTAPRSGSARMRSTRLPLPQTRWITRRTVTLRTGCVRCCYAVDSPYWLRAVAFGLPHTLRCHACTVTGLRGLRPVARVLLAGLPRTVDCNAARCYLRTTRPAVGCS